MRHALFTTLLFLASCGPTTGGNADYRPIQAGQMAGSLQTVHTGHPDIKQDDIRLRGLGQPQGLDASARFTAAFIGRQGG
jgi:hypothetical protein